jgi:hypothetical protein
MSHPLSLSSAQLAIVMAAAERVPAGSRFRFLSAVADNLIGRTVDDATVQAVACEAVTRMGVQPDLRSTIGELARRIGCEGCND